MSSSSEHPDDGALEGINFMELLPLELTLKIFGYLYEDDLIRCALVSRKFRIAANDKIFWKPLYQEVFEYSLPLLHVAHAQFEFREPHDWPQPRSDESIINPWKESFKQLRNAQALQKDGIHVRPGYASLYSGFDTGGLRLTHCDRLDQALQLVETRGKNVEKLIFLHTGLYIPETPVMINSGIQIIGASASPDIASRVIIEGRLTTPVVLAEGSQGAYLGWMTVRFAPDSDAVAAAVAAAIAAGNRPMRIYCNALQICDDSTALVEHCVIHSSATFGAAVCVMGSAANPKMRHCVVCDCGSVGIRVTDAAQGQFEDCEIARNNLSGIRVNNRANPFFRRCHIHDGRGVGILTYDNGMGYFESCNIHNNRSSGIRVRSAANPTVTRCEGRGQFLENRLHSNARAGVTISSELNPTFRRNRVYEGYAAGIEIRSGAMATLESNDIFHNRFGGLLLAPDVRPTLRGNTIYDNDNGDLVEETAPKGGCFIL